MYPYISLEKTKLSVEKFQVRSTACASNREMAFSTASCDAGNVLRGLTPVVTSGAVAFIHS